MPVAALTALLLLGSPAGSEADESWRWRSHWALAEHFDLSVVESPSSLPKDPEVRVPRSTPGFPAAVRDSVLRVHGRGVLQLPRRGEPRPFVEYRGSVETPIRALALGTRGLLMLVDEPALGGEALLEVRYRPAFEYPYRIGHEPRVRDGTDARGHAVMAHAGCFSCHSLHGRRQVGPSLDRESLVKRLRARLDDDDYRRQVAALDELEAWAQRQWREERAQVLAAEGPERLRVWMRWHLVEPSFDNLQARMPSMGLDGEQVEAVSDFLLGSLEH